MVNQRSAKPSSKDSAVLMLKLSQKLTTSFHRLSLKLT